MRTNIGNLFVFLNLIILTTSSCLTNDNRNERITAYIKHYKSDHFHKTDTIYLSISSRGKILNYNYSDSNFKDGFISFAIDKQNDSILMFYEHNCPLVATKNFEINGKQFLVKKYYYDIEDMIDEESSFLYHDKYGLLMDFNHGWSDLKFTIEYDETSAFLIDLILNDSSSFYRKSFRPIPSPSNGDIYQIKIEDE